MAQETDIQSTKDIDTRLKEQLKKNDEALRQLLNKPLASDFLDSLTSDQPLSRGLDDLGTPGILQVNFLMEMDRTYQVTDNNGLKGFVLTGKWISDYAKKIKLVPALEKTLSGYRQQTELNNQLLGEMELALGIKDQKIEVLEEMNGALKERGDLYKTKSEIAQGSWLTRTLRSLSYPIGFTAGVFVGVIIAK